MLQLIWKMRVVLGLLPSFLQIQSYLLPVRLAFHFICDHSTSVCTSVGQSKWNAFTLQNERMFLDSVFWFVQMEELFPLFYASVFLKERYFSQSKLIFHIHATWILFLWFVLTPMKVTAKMHLFFWFGLDLFSCGRMCNNQTGSACTEFIHFVRVWKTLLQTKLLRFIVCFLFFSLPTVLCL